MTDPDLNLLIYAVNSSARHHAASREWWEDILNAGEPVGLPWLVLLGFLRLTTSAVLPLWRGKIRCGSASAIVRRRLYKLHPPDDRLISGEGDAESRRPMEGY